MSDTLAAENARLTRAWEAMQKSKTKSEAEAKKWFELYQSKGADLNALKAAVFGSADYDPNLKIGNFVEMAQMTERARQGALERAEKAEAAAVATRDTLNAWFDQRKLVAKEIDATVLDAVRGYLRTSRSGGMPKSTSDTVEAVLGDMVRLSAFADIYARAWLTERDTHAAQLAEAYQQIAALREALKEAHPYVAMAEFLESRAFSYGSGYPEPSPAEWGITVAYFQTAEQMPLEQFADEVEAYHQTNREEDDGSGEFLTLANKLAALAQTEGAEG